jgi:ABC-type oligopeptide transport system substrate-binding subunit
MSATRRSMVATATVVALTAALLLAAATILSIQSAFADSQQQKASVKINQKNQAHVHDKDPGATDDTVIAQDNTNVVDQAQAQDGSVNF